MRWKCVNFLPLIFTFLARFYARPFAARPASFAVQLARYAYAAYDKVRTLHGGHSQLRKFPTDLLHYGHARFHAHRPTPLPLPAPVVRLYASLEPQQFKLNNKMGAENRCGFLFLFLSLVPYPPCFCCFPAHQFLSATLCHGLRSTAAFGRRQRREAASDAVVGVARECLSFTSHANFMISTRKNLVVFSPSTINELRAENQLGGENVM